MQYFSCAWMSKDTAGTKNCGRCREVAFCGGSTVPCRDLRKDPQVQNSAKRDCFNGICFGQSSVGFAGD